jgi:hypothetical protein
MTVSAQVLAAGAKRRYISAGFPKKSCALAVSAAGTFRLKAAPEEGG